MTFGLACDEEGYDLRIMACEKCGSRGCPHKREVEKCDGKRNPLARARHYDSRGYCDNPSRGY